MRCSPISAIAVPGRMNTWREKNRLRVAPEMSGPPRTRDRSQLPAKGTRSTIAAPMPRPQYASASQRMTWPVKARASVVMQRKTPTTQVSSLGYL